MKMEKASDYISNNDVSRPLPTDIGREFVRQYYTKWSFQLNDVFQFYGNESFFLHDGHEAKGQEDIQKTIDNLNFENCKARIHSVSGVYGVNDSLVLQVCGELSINDAPPRKFLQNFVLCKQMTKKYYVQTDIFQWLDKAFCTDVSDGAKLAVKEAKKETAKKEKDNEKITTPKQNGHLPNQNQQAAALPDLSSLGNQSIGDDSTASKEHLSNLNREPPSLGMNTSIESPTKPVVGPAQTQQPKAAAPPIAPNTTSSLSSPINPTAPPTQPSAPPSTNAQQAPTSQPLQQASPESHWKNFREKRANNNAGGGQFNNNGSGAPPTTYRYHNRDGGAPQTFRGGRGGPPGGRFSTGGGPGGGGGQNNHRGGGYQQQHNKYGGPPGGGRGMGGGGPRFQQNSQQHQQPNSSTFK